MPRLARVVEAHLEKARSACRAAVENYNKPGAAFRTWVDYVCRKLRDAEEFARVTGKPPVLKES